jgi:hypothetical protein
VINIYKDEIKKSLNQLRLKLIFPDILFFIVSLLLLGMFTRITGLANIAPEALETGLESYVAANFGSLVGSLFVFVLVAFFIGAGLKAFKLKMIIEAMKGKEFNMWKAFQDSHKFYWRVIGLKILSLVILLIGFVAAIIIYLLLRNLFEVLAMVLAVLLLIYIVLALLLKEAALFQKNLNAADAIKNSFKTFSKNRMLVFGLLVIVLIVNFAAAILEGLFPESTGAMGIIISTVFLLIVLLISAWGNLFTFNVYQRITKKTPRKIKRAKKKTTKRRKK